MSHAIAITASATTAPHNLSSYSPQQQIGPSTRARPLQHQRNVNATVHQRLPPQPTIVQNTLTPTNVHFTCQIPIHEQRVISQIARLSSQHHLSDYSKLKFGECGCAIPYVPLTVQGPAHLEELQSRQAIEVSRASYFPATGDASQPIIDSITPEISREVAPMTQTQQQRQSSVDLPIPGQSQQSLTSPLDTPQSRIVPSLNRPSSPSLHNDLNLAITSMLALPPVVPMAKQPQLPAPSINPSETAQPGLVHQAKTSDSHPINISQIVPSEILPAISAHFAKEYPTYFPSPCEFPETVHRFDPTTIDSPPSLPVSFSVPEHLHLNLPANLHVHAQPHHLPPPPPPAQACPPPFIPNTSHIPTAPNGRPLSTTLPAHSPALFVSKPHTPHPLSQTQTPRAFRSGLGSSHDHLRGVSPGRPSSLYGRNAMTPWTRHLPPDPSDTRSSLEIQEALAEALKNPPSTSPIPRSSLNPASQIHSGSPSTSAPIASLPFPLTSTRVETPPLVSSGEGTPTIPKVEGPQLGNLFLSSCPGKKVRLQGPVRGRGTICRSLSSDLARIASLNVKLVINCLDDTELAFLGASWDEYSRIANALGVDVLRIPTPEGLAPLDTARLDQQLDWVIRRYTLRGVNILVHCRGGVGRAGLVAASWVIKLGLCGPTSSNPSLPSQPPAIELASPTSPTYPLTLVPSSQASWATLASQGLLRNDTLFLVERVITVIRKRRSMKAIETYEQARFLIDFVEYLRERERAAKIPGDISMEHDELSETASMAGWQAWTPTSTIASLSTLSDEHMVRSTEGMSGSFAVEGGVGPYDYTVTSAESNQMMSNDAPPDITFT